MHMWFMVAGTLITVAGLAGTLLSGHLHFGGGLYFKMTASTGFLVVAVAAGGLRSVYGYILLAALVGCWFGDLALGLPGERVFLAGLVSFLLGHVGFAVAFWLRGIDPKWCVGALVLLTPCAVVILMWLYPHVPKDMRFPVLAYMAVISAMVVLAAGTRGAGATPLILLGAVAFYVSDIFVARARFVTPGFANALIGLPIYYASVVLMAYSIAAQNTPK